MVDFYVRKGSIIYLINTNIDEKKELHSYLDKVPKTRVTIRRSSALFLLPPFSNINPVEKGIIPVASTFIQVL
jgi:hypothetical protein